jgi:hypothetical protein
VFWNEKHFEKFESVVAIVFQSAFTLKKKGLQFQ